MSMTNRSAFHEFVQPDLWDASKFTKVRTIRGAIHGKVELHLCHEAGQEDTCCVVKCMENEKVNFNRGKEVCDKKVHFFTNRCAAPHLEDALTEIGVFAYLSKQKKQCPFLLRMLGVFSDHHLTRLVTEEADGGELFDLVAAQGPVSEKRAALYVCQILLALQFLKEHYVGHRDVSLENILLKNGDVRLMDFGQAVQSHLPDGTPLRFFTTAGKKAYRAPEMHVPTHGVTCARVDVPMMSERQSSKTRKDHGVGVLFLKLQALGYLCEVKVPENTCGTSCDAELMGYMVPPADVFACGVCMFILCLGFPPWDHAMLSDPHFAHIHRLGDGGIPDIMQRYAQSTLSTEFTQLVVEMMSSDPSLRPTVEESLSSSWLRTVAGEVAASVQEEQPTFSEAIRVDIAEANSERILDTVAGEVNVSLKEQEGALSDSIPDTVATAVKESCERIPDIAVKVGVNTAGLNNDINIIAHDTSSSVVGEHISKVQVDGCADFGKELTCQDVSRRRCLRAVSCGGG